MGASIRDAELAALRQAIDELETERASAQSRATLLEHLARALAVIAAAREPDEVIAGLLRAAQEPLRFKRAVYFERRHDVLIARSAVGEFPSIPTTLIPSGVFAPLAGARGAWIFTPLVYDRQTNGFLYADGRQAVDEEDYREPLNVLVAVAAAALRGSFLYRKLSELALRDPLTGLLNRRSLEARLHDDIEASRRSNCECVVVILDVDDFKRVNDVAGHLVGDAVLERVATTLSQVAREIDLVGRLGGDEFVMMFNRTISGDARSVVRRLSSELRRNGLRCSVGAAMFPRDGNNVVELLRAADRALYRVKAAGKNGFAFAIREDLTTSDLT